jgi:hypothetical protein
VKPRRSQKNHRDLAAVALEERVLAGRHHQVGELRRQESAQPAEPLELIDLRLDALLELTVEGGELRRLRHDRVVVLLYP